LSQEGTIPEVDSFFHVGKGLLITDDAYVALKNAATSSTTAVTLVDDVIDLVWPGRTFLACKPPDGVLKEPNIIPEFHRVRMQLAASFVVHLTAAMMRKGEMSIKKAKEIIMIKVC
jgi:hypothetical protein